MVHEAAPRQSKKNSRVNLPSGTTEHPNDRTTERLPSCPTPPIFAVLVAPREAGNVGAAARAVKNIGLAGLRLVDPCPLGLEARKMAWRSLDVLARAATFPTLADALADCVRAVGFTARPQRTVNRILTLPEAAPAILEHATRGPVGLVFGPENFGLARAHLRHCQDIVRIPMQGTQPSLNLAQAVLLAGYEVLLARLPSGGRPAAPTRTPPLPGKPATVPDILAIERALLGAIEALGYGEVGRSAVATRTLDCLRALLDRAGLTVQDANMFRGLAARIRQVTGGSPGEGP
jgi:TrmH family RNA methyltransferase